MADPAEDRAELVAGDAAADWEDAPGETSIEVFDAFAAQLGDAFGQADAERRILYGFVFHEVTTTYLGSSTGLRLRHVQPTGHYGCTGKNAELTNSAWVGGATRDFADVDAAQMAADLATRLGWGERRIDLPAGRYDTVLPPTRGRRPDDLRLLGVPAPATPHDGRRCSPSRAAAPGSARRSSNRGVTAATPTRRTPACECAPFVVAGGSSDRSSVYDNGLPLGSDRLDRRRTADLADPDPAHRRRSPASRRPRPSTTSCSTSTGRRAPRPTWSAGLDDGLLLTCLWYIREVDPQTLLLTGLTRDGVYRVEGGEITGAVNNFRFNESPIDLLRRYTHASETVPSFSREWGEDYFSRTATPALRIPDFNMSSVSQAL